MDEREDRRPPAAARAAAGVMLSVPQYSFRRAPDYRDLLTARCLGHGPLQEGPAAHPRAATRRVEEAPRAIQRDKLRRATNRAPPSEAFFRRDEDLPRRPAPSTDDRLTIAPPRLAQQRKANLQPRKAPSRSTAARAASRESTLDVPTGQCRRRSPGRRAGRAPRDRGRTAASRPRGHVKCRYRRRPTARSVAIAGRRPSTAATSPCRRAPAPVTKTIFSLRSAIVPALHRCVLVASRSFASAMSPLQPVV